MHFPYRSFFPALLLSATAQCAAAGEAATYSGTIGKLPVIVELQASDLNGSFFGRYAYVKKGTDIPLHGTETKAGFALEEEKPCTEKLCKTEDEQLAEQAPIGADWTLKPDGKMLVGTWKDRQSGKSLPVRLMKKATRPISDDQSGMDILDPSFSEKLNGAQSVVTKDDLPYDFLKMAEPLKTGTEKTVGDGAYRLDTDPRTKLDYPVLTRLAGTDPAPLNAWLAQQRLQWSLPAFACRSKAYLSAGWMREGNGDSNGYDGDALVSVDFLTPRLLGLTESGMYFCNGAYPNTFVTHRLADARTGKPLIAETLLRGWVAKNADGAVVDPAGVADPSELSWGPNDELVEFVRKHREKFDDETEKDCGMDELVSTNLGVYIKGGELVFTLTDLAHAIFACTNDVLKVPLKDARPLLTEAGAKFFAELDK
jgi:hypothetical protein